MSAAVRRDDASGDPLFLRGFAPLVVAAILVALAILLVPSVAPEQIVVDRPSATLPPLPTTATTAAVTDTAPASTVTTVAAP